ncbi:MAG: phosphate ABC transporter permease PstA [Chloroflexota bacterium]|nr:phosphate ABC transporter permease PstA [Chloroflexota bacterium]
MSAQSTAAIPSADVWRPSQTRRRWSGWLFYGLAVFSTLMGLVMLGALLYDIFTDGAREVDWHFLSNYPSRIADNAGLRSALLGSLWMLAFTAIIAFPLGVGAAIYLEEYAPDNWLTRFIQLNIANLAGVPSIVYGLLGLGLFVRWLELGRVVLAGSMTMALLILPLIIVASREAIRAVPDSLREGSYALGATRWQMVRQTVLPSAAGGILTGTILALARAIGETAPLITIGALTYVAFDPNGPLDIFTVLPIQIFNWVSLPQKEFHSLAAGGIVVLLVVLLTANSLAVYLRYRMQRRLQ